MPYKTYWAADLTGGGTGAADKIPTADLADKNVVIVPRLSDLQTYLYAVDDDLAGTESSPSLITPDDESGDKRLTLLGITLPNTGLHLLDTNASNYINLKWNEDDTGDRTLNLLVEGADRTLDLYENLKVVDGQDIELHASGGEKAQLAIDTQNAERTLDLSENLTIANGSNVTLQALGQANSLILNESLTIGDGNSGTITFGNASNVLTINETMILAGATGKTLTLNENFTIGDGTNITITGITAARTITLNENLTVGDGTDITLTGVTQANTLTLHESFTIGNGNDGTITFSAASKVFSIDETVTLSAKANLAGPTFSGTVAVPSTNFTIGSTTFSETQLGEVTTFFDSTDISGAEAETLTDTSDADALHGHGTLVGAHAMLDGSVHNDSVADAVTRGSIIYGNASSPSKWDELVVGTGFLRGDGTDCAWLSYANTIVALSGAAGAAFSLNEQALTNVGAIGCDAVTLVNNYDITLGGTGHITSGSEGFIVGTLTITDGSIDDTDGTIAFGATNFTGVGTIGCGTISCTSDILLENANYIGIGGAERLEFYTAGYANFVGCKVGIGTPTALENFEVRSPGFTYVIVSSNRDGDGGIQSIGMVGFYGKNDAAEDIRYVRMDGTILDGSDASEDGELNIYTMVGGLETSTMTITGGNVDIITHDAATVGLKLGGTLVAASAAELNILDGVTATATELNYLDGQTAQLILTQQVFS